MAPAGPPPYSFEQIKEMTSPEEQRRARAELESYIARLKKEKEEREISSLNGYSGPARPAELAFGPGPRNFSPYSGAAPRGSYSNTSRAGYKRGGYSGRHGSYHPYQRPQTTQKFANRSVTFNNIISSAQPAKASETMDPPWGPDDHPNPTSRDQLQTGPTSLCPAFTSTGLCVRHGCYHVHDSSKQALCKRWLYKDDCSRGQFCQLSHEASAHNAPTCLHFQEGGCKNDKCRFAHVRLNPATPNCEAFGRLGYCEKGDSCSEFHAHECPTFSNTGACQYGDNCRLGHVHRASRMRKTARLDRSSPLETLATSDAPEEDLDTVEDVQYEIISKAKSAQKPHHFTQQLDFVPLEADS